MNRRIHETLQRFPELKDGLQFVGETHQRNAFMKEKFFSEIYPEMKAKYPSVPEAVLIKKANQRVNGKMRVYCLNPVPSGVYAESYANNSPASRSAKGITANRVHGRNAASWVEKIKKDVASKFHPEGCDTIKSVIDHEFGHQLDNLLKISEDQFIIDMYRGFTNDDLTNGLSRYSWKNDNPKKIREFVAEGWAEYCNNPPESIRPIAKAIGQHIEMRYKAWK